jgi:hypothetical protein
MSNLDRQHDDWRGAQGEGVAVELDLRRRPACWASSLGWPGPDAEERDLHALGPALGRRVLADAEQEVGGDRMQVGRVAEQLELA